MKKIADALNRADLQLILDQSRIYKVYDVLGLEQRQSRSLFVKIVDSILVEVYEFTGFYPEPTRDLRELYTNPNSQIQIPF